MQKAVLWMLLCCGAIRVNAQILVRDDKGLLRDFKATTTVFIIPRGDKPEIATFRKAIGDVWTVTPFVVTTSDSTAFINSKAYSLFSFRTIVSSGNSTHTHVWYSLSMLKEKKSKKNPGLEPALQQVAGIMLYPEESYVLASMRMPDFDPGTARGEEIEAVMGERMTNNTRYNNWGAGYLKNYLHFINSTILAGKNQWNYGAIHADGMKAIPKDTLFVPTYLKATFNPVNAGEGERDEESISKAYPYPIAFLETEEMNRRILHAQKPFYYMLYVRSSTDKFVTVVDAYKDAILYSVYKAISYNFKSKDMRKVAEAME